ncbi:SDR family oxidoreductase [Microbacterium sp. zg.Y1090]|uniref:SDR family NAD(P)-dependent oxidoreductase n=1 Tax=Microbacterium TaxID=33882 RepID=UPI00214BAB03|nr:MULTISPECIES: SDR family oxidoreductase [unclassified Microbacterium]MCR2813307.1 SDR family oxidoreductase [Microbacterium sp. zg.Y1084]MCR2819859.1 SDR family oxidoreductase [Microbacterium sp. zg.Y1090]MDL5487970.1 SDR family oxidoreductase [Microbacterium sp. zg-Y1211]WIM28584.1 SDR family oxidoreductase [Microbacterium sp. zg-Y1090]
MTAIDLGFPSDGAILITGAGSGIGRATALRAAQMGLATSLWDLSAEGLEQTATLIRDAGGARVHTWVGDVSDRAVVEAGVAAAVNAVGPVRYLHNNAGPASRSALPFDDALRISVGSVRLMTEAWAGTDPGPGAAMVVTASVAGNLVGTDSDWYSASKAALTGYVRHLAAHRGGQFRSNAVAPGMTDTPRLADFAASEMGHRVLERIPLRRMAAADDIAYATLFLLSPIAGYINGVLLPVDGGWTVTQ